MCVFTNDCIPVSAVEYCTVKCKNNLNFNKVIAPRVHL